MSVEAVVVACYEYSTYKVWLKDGRTALTRHVKIRENSFNERTWYTAIPNAVFMDDESPIDQVQPKVRQDLPTKPRMQMQPAHEKPASSVTRVVTADELEMLTHVPAHQSTHDEEEPRGEQDAQREHEEAIEGNNQEEEMMIEDSEEDVVKDLETDQDQGSLQDDRWYPQRSRTSPQYYSPGNAYVTKASGDPYSVKQAMNSFEADHWMRAISDEMESLY